MRPALRTAAALLPCLLAACASTEPAPPAQRPLRPLGCFPVEYQAWLSSAGLDLREQEAAFEVRPDAGAEHVEVRCKLYRLDAAHADRLLAECAPGNGANVVSRSVSAWVAMVMPASYPKFGAAGVATMGAPRRVARDLQKAPCRARTGLRSRTCCRRR